MESTQSKLFSLLLRLFNKKNFLVKWLNAGKPFVFGSARPPFWMRISCDIKQTTVCSRRVFTIRARTSRRSDKQILYFHGGAYVQNFMLFHWSFLAGLAKSSGCT